MGLGDLFKSKAERERDAQKKRRKAFRDAENAVDLVKERVGKMKAERDKAWGEAKKYLRDGQKGAAQRCLQTCRASELLMSKLEMKRWVFEQLLSKLELAKSDQDFTQALGAINTVVKIDPEAVANVLDEVHDKLGEQVDTDKIWERVYGKEMEGVKNREDEVVPSMEDLEKQLQDEVAAEIGGSPSAGQRIKSGDGGGVKDRIGDGKARLKKLMEGDR